MFTKLLTKMAVCSVLCALLTFLSCALSTDTSTSTAAVDSSTGRGICAWENKELYDILGLKQDATDSEIIQLLDIPEKRIIATLLIRYRKISSATPKLLEIVRDVNDSDAFIMYKIAAAEALCDFGNREWMPTIKALSTDPNSFVGRYIPEKIKVAGLLARAGDYSQFKVVAKGISDSKRSIRSTAIHALSNFGHKTDPVTDSAAELLTFAATSDPVPWLRERAIDALEKIAKTKPQITSKVIDALEANIDSPDKNLRRVCRVKLTIYGRKLKTD